eukprot:Nk52_evm4s2171 gene=Nk52_evmTU4s2171
MNGPRGSFLYEGSPLIPRPSHRQDYDGDLERVPEIEADRISISSGISEAPKFEFKISYENENERPESILLPCNSDREDVPRSYPKLSSKLYEIENRGSWETLLTRVPYYIPSVKWMREYRISNLKNDVIAGITIATMLVPQALSYSHLARVPPIHALYTALVPVVVYSLMGTSPHMGIGPEALTSILVGHGLKMHSVSPDDFIPLSIALALIVGLISFLFGLLRLGFMDSILSRALLRGFILAAGVVIIIEQLEVVFGIHVHWPADCSTIYKAFYIVEHFSELHPLTSCIGIGSSMFLVGIAVLKGVFSHHRAVGFIPGILLAVVLNIFLSWNFDWASSGVPVLGTVVSKPPEIKMPIITADIFHDLLGTAIIITVVGFVESLAAGKIYSAKYNYPLSANRELVAMGMANVVGAFFGTYPVFGSLARSNVKDSCSVRTQMSDLITGIAIGLSIAYLLPVFYFLPKAAMGSIVLIAATGLMEFEDLVFLWKVRAYKELGLCMFTFLITIFVGVDTGILMSVLISLLFVLKHTTLPKVSLLGRVGNTDKYRDVREFPEADIIEGVLALKLEESLYFANAAQIKDVLRRVENLGSFGIHPSEKMTVPKIKHVIFDMRGVPYMDASALQIVYEIVESYHTRGITVSFVKVRPPILEFFHKSGLVELVSKEHIFVKISDALHFLEGRYSDFERDRTQSLRYLPNPNDSGGATDGYEGEEIAWAGASCEPSNNCVPVQNTRYLSIG